MVRRQGWHFLRRIWTALPSPLPGSSSTPRPLSYPVLAAVTSLHRLLWPFRSPPLDCGSVCEKEQCLLHPLQTSLSLVPDRVTPTSESLPFQVEGASHPAAQQCLSPPTWPCHSLLPRETSPHHVPALHPCLAILQVHLPGRGPLQTSKQPAAFRELHFMSLVI